MNRLLHKLLYRILPLGGYLQTVSAMFFLSHRLGIGRHAPATEYTFHLDRLMRADPANILALNRPRRHRCRASPAATATSTPWNRGADPMKGTTERLRHRRDLTYALAPQEGEIRMGTPPSGRAATSARDRT